MDGYTRGAADGSGSDPQAGGIDPPPAPPDTLPYDPEGGGVPVVPAYTPDTNDSALPADVLYQLSEVEAALKEGHDATTEAIRETAADAARRVDSATSEVHAVIGGVAGSVLARTDEATASLTRIVDGIFRGVSRKLGGVSDELRGAGVAMPYDPAEWQLLLDADPGEWLPYMVPEIGAVVGVGTGDNLSVAADVDCAKYPTDPACLPGGGLPPPNDPPVILPTDVIVCWDGTILPPGSSINDCPPRVPPIPPPLDPPLPTDCPTLPPAPVCCDTPVNVSVVVPPIVIPPQGPGGPTSPGQTCPPPLQDISFSPEIKNEIVIPPPVEAGEVPGPPLPGVPRDFDKPPTLDWKRATACRDVNRILDELQPGDGTVGGTFGVDLSDVDFLFGSINSSYLGDMNQPLKEINDGLRAVVDGIMSAPMMLLNAGEHMVHTVLSEIGGDSVPNPAAAGLYGFKLMAATWAERQTGFPLTYLMQAEQYAFQYANPQYLPSQSQIDMMWVMNRIDEETWTCWTQAHGNIADHFRKARDAQIGQPNLNELTQLRLRKLLTRDEYYDRAAKLGWRNPSHVTDVFNLATQIPTQSDLLRMMVRDAADDDVAKKYGYDTDFDKKFVGQLKDWSEAQGVPAEVFKYSWRAHWEIPSATQLYEMFHRLRPDREEVRQWEREVEGFGDAIPLEFLVRKPPVVTLKDVQEALQINDKAPGWIDRLLAVSYHPITRTDAIRAYSIGAFSEEKLYSSMLDNGYNPKDARTLTDYYVSQTVRSNSNATGVLTLRKIARLYKDGALSRLEALEALTPIMVDPKMREQLIARIDLEWKAEHRADRLKGMRKRYVAGEPMPGGWLPQITAVTGDAVSAQRVLDSWNVAYSLRLRETSALMLCKWYKGNVIGMDDYLDRLTNLGYTLRDAERIAAVCDQEKRAALAKEVERRLKEATAAAEKKIKYQDKLRERECHPPKPCWDGSTPPPPRA